MSWLDDLLGKTVLQNGALLPDRKMINFIGGPDLVISDNPILKATDVTTQGASFVRAYGNIVLAVDSVHGSDAPSATRPSVLSEGDWSAYPFATIQAAIASLPPLLGAFHARIDVVGGGTISLSGLVRSGVERPLPSTDITANNLTSGTYAEIAAHSGGGQLNATPIGQRLTKIKTAAVDHDSIRFQSAAELIGMGFGAHGFIKNRTSKIVDLYPPNDGSTIYHGNTAIGVNTPYGIPAGAMVFWFAEADPSNALGAVSNWNIDP